MRRRDEEFFLSVKLDPRRSGSMAAPAPKQFLNTYDGIDLCDRSNLASEASSVGRLLWSK